MRAAGAPCPAQAEAESVQPKRLGYPRRGVPPQPPPPPYPRSRDRASLALAHGSRRLTPHTRAAAVQGAGAGGEQRGGLLRSGAGGVPQRGGGGRGAVRDVPLPAHLPRPRRPRRPRPRLPPHALRRPPLLLTCALCIPPTPPPPPPSFWITPSRPSLITPPTRSAWRRAAEEGIVGHQAPKADPSRADAA